MVKHPVELMEIRLKHNEVKWALEIKTKHHSFESCNLVSDFLLVD